MHRTGVPRYLLTLLLGGLASTAAAESLEPGPDEARLYYQRNDNAYVGWGLHLWNTPQCTSVRDGTRRDQPPAAAGRRPRIWGLVSHPAEHRAHHTCARQ